ncbi:lymphotoxin-alpha-like [Protopterus annectens]|uniref:lymphotoxin-alpha-like n=1 Tax=Protopterus annectens TaxID=7888 RepID=UPI001CFA8017|nr:lymphotoxin-alpha-like [Protopterus annectens]
MSAENMLCEMEKGGVMVVREVKRSRPCWTWISIAAFLILVTATVILTLLYFQVLPKPKDGKQVGQLSEELIISTAIPKGKYEEPACMTFLSVTLSELKYIKVPFSLKQIGSSSLVPAAHLVAEIEGDKLLWSADRDHAFLMNGMKLSENALLIPADGLYFVYSQVVFSGKEYNSKKPWMLSHNVMRYSNEYEKDMVLFGATKSICADGFWSQPIYQGAVFRLSKGDLLRTHTDPISKVDESADHTYFGIFAL